MEHGPERLVKVREQYEGELREVVKTLDPTGFAQIASTSRGRSASPKKRKASETLLPVVEAKRRCDSSHLCRQMPDDPNGGNDQPKEHCTPSLLSDVGTSSQSLPTTAPESLPPFGPLANWELEADRVSSLRMHELRKRRPLNHALLCCDYSLAERANALGLPGKPEYGGGHLCEECLGLGSFLYTATQEGTEEATWDNG
ncbi:hypothetical protein LTS18_004455 [Coniosporium uncinatum]|uniref:Uncharacterized protein n=1 Tax=Coniosporium uncinatum TaxID=93489 RepID=A0ACC3D632_9PEZI|nr:hypothetical protein LTS18_004455 [Coniosporium uncinatum]